MKTFYLAAVLSAIYGAEAAYNSTTTTVCAECPPASTTPDVVTRSDVPTSSCTAPSLTASYYSSTTSTVYTTSVYTITSCPPTVTNCPVGQKTTEVISLYTTVCPLSGMTTTYATTPVATGTGVMPTGSAMPTSSVVPITAGASKIAGGISGAMALAAAAVYLM